MSQEAEQSLSVGRLSLMVGIGTKLEREAKRVADRMNAALNPEVIRFPAVRVQLDIEGYDAFTSGDFLVVDVSKIAKISAANRFLGRDRFSTELLRRLGFISGKDMILEQMLGVNGNVILEFDHPTLPYKAEFLVHNMGDEKHLISGFVISPK